MERLAGFPLKGCKGSNFVPMVEAGPPPKGCGGGAAWYYGGWLRLYDGASSQVAVHRPLACLEPVLPPHSGSWQDLKDPCAAPARCGLRLATRSSKGRALHVAVCSIASKLQADCRVALAEIEKLHMGLAADKS